MEYEFNLFLMIFIIDFFVWLLIKKICKLEIGFFGILFSQICTLAALALLFVEGLAVCYFMLAKFVAAFLITLLVVNDYSFSSIFSVFGLFIVTALSIYGYYEFLVLIAKSIGLSTKVYFEAIFAGCFVLFYLFLYFLFSILSKSKTLQSFLADVSFCLLNKHITLKGLIDSGNSVYDKKTNLPVVLISVDSLKKYLPLASFCYVKDMLASHLEKCTLVGGKTIYVPIVKVEGCKVIKNGKILSKNFMVGVVEKKFYDEKHYDCLLHRDFV